MSTIHKGLNTPILKPIRIFVLLAVSTLFSCRAPVKNQKLSAIGISPVASIVIATSKAKIELKASPTPVNFMTEDSKIEEIF